MSYYVDHELKKGSRKNKTAQHYSENSTIKGGNLFHNDKNKLQRTFIFIYSIYFQSDNINKRINKFIKKIHDKL